MAWAAMRRRTLARVVLTLLLVATLLPTLSRALAHARGAAQPWAQGCATAVLATAQARATPADTESWHRLLSHCPLCSLGPDLPDGVLPAPPVLPLLALADAGPSAANATSYLALAARWRAQPRAPPTIS